jgi:hypothetical protein
MLIIRHLGLLDQENRIYRIVIVVFLRMKLQHGHGVLVDYVNISRSGTAGVHDIGHGGVS